MHIPPYSESSIQDVYIMVKALDIKKPNYFEYATPWRLQFITYLLNYLLTHSLTRLINLSLTYSLTYLLTYSLTYVLTHSLTY